MNGKPQLDITANTARSLCWLNWAGLTIQTWGVVVVRYAENVAGWLNKEYRSMLRQEANYVRLVKEIFC